MQVYFTMLFILLYSVNTIMLRILNWLLLNWAGFSIGDWASKSPFFVEEWLPELQLPDGAMFFR